MNWLLFRTHFYNLFSTEMRWKCEIFFSSVFMFGASTFSEKAEKSLHYFVLLWNSKSDRRTGIVLRWKTENFQNWDFPQRYTNVPLESWFRAALSSLVIERARHCGQDCSGGDGPGKPICSTKELKWLVCADHFLGRLSLFKGQKFSIVPC